MWQKSGFLLIELLVSLGILSVAALSLSMVYQSSQHLLFRTKALLEAHERVHQSIAGVSDPCCSIEYRSIGDICATIAFHTACIQYAPHKTLRYTLCVAAEQ